MARVGGIGDAGQAARAIAQQPQQTPPETTQPQDASREGRTDSPGGLGYDELESQARAARGSVAGSPQVQGQQQTQSPQSSRWPVRVFRETANVEDRPVPQSEESSPPREERQTPSSSRIDLMA